LTHIPIFFDPHPHFFLTHIIEFRGTGRDHIHRLGKAW